MHLLLAFRCAVAPSEMLAASTRCVNDFAWLDIEMYEEHLS